MRFERKTNPEKQNRLLWKTQNQFLAIGKLIYRNKNKWVEEQKGHS